MMSSLSSVYSCMNIVKYVCNAILDADVTCCGKWKVECGVILLVSDTPTVWVLQQHSNFLHKNCSD